MILFHLVIKYLDQHPHNYWNGVLGWGMVAMNIALKGIVQRKLTGVETRLT
jgi:hypothetical protein